MPTARFAAVVCCELLEHLAEDPMRMAAEINRILRPGGRLVLSTPNICALRSVAAILRGRHPGVCSQYTARKGGNEAEPPHAREYTPGEVGKLFAAGGVRGRAAGNRRLRLRDIRGSRRRSRALAAGRLFAASARCLHPRRRQEDRSRETALSRLAVRLSERGCAAPLRGGDSPAAKRPYATIV